MATTNEDFENESISNELVSFSCTKKHKADDVKSNVIMNFSNDVCSNFFYQFCNDSGDAYLVANSCFNGDVGPDSIIEDEKN